MRLLLQSLRETKRDDGIDGLTWIFWTLVGMMPLWALMLILKIRAQPITLEALAGKGELALYSAAVLSGTLYVVLKEIKPSSLFDSWNHARHGGRPRGFSLSFPGYGFLVCILFLLMLFSAVAFTTVTGAQTVPSPLATPDLDKQFVHKFTLALLGLAVLLGYGAMVIDNWFMRERDLIAMRQQGFDSFEQRFDEIESED